jgi:osmotically-inducible protein OsmY
MRELPTIAVLLAVVLASGGCAAGYKEAADAAMSPLSAPAQARDMRLKAQLRETLLLNQSYAGLEITPDVVMERGYLVGFVDNREQAEQIVTAANSVGGLRSLDSYLPTRPASDSKETDIALKGEVKAAIALSPALVTSRYTVESLDGTIVLLGATMTEEEREGVAQSARSVDGVKDVRNFLLVVEPGYSSLRPHVR